MFGLLFAVASLTNAVAQARVWEAHDRLKQEACAVEFGDMTRLFLRLLKTHAGARRAFGARHQHIFVDEFQDNSTM